MNGNELVDEIGQAVNSGVDPSEVRDAVKREHNAIQRYLFRQVIKPVILGLAETPHVDARNEGTVEQCREIADAMGWEYDD